MPFLKSLRFDGLLSFPPGSEVIELTPLNVLIGPNGSGKSNLIEGVELLHALPTGFASAIRRGGGASEWLWKGDHGAGKANIEVQLTIDSLSYEGSPPRVFKLGDSKHLRYYFAFAEVGQRVAVQNEVIEDSPLIEQDGRIHGVYYELLNDKAVLQAVNARAGDYPEPPVRDLRYLQGNMLKAGESVLSQFRDVFVYPELTLIANRFEAIQSFREWTFGPDSAARKPQPADLPPDILAPDARNLGLLLNRLEHSGAWSEFNGYLTRFLPRFERYSTRIEGGTVQFYLHESGLKLPVPATRLSDGTIRFIAILAQLLSPAPPPLICMEEPELGLHPDAITLLASLLQEASTRTQLIVTTHSDALVSALTEQADSVLVCEYRNGTIFQRVDSSKLRFWLDKYRLGEIWRIGEIGGNL